jgi:hypothetical protein
VGEGKIQTERGKESGFGGAEEVGKPGSKEDAGGEGWGVERKQARKEESFRSGYPDEKGICKTEETGRPEFKEGSMTAIVFDQS